MSLAALLAILALVSDERLRGLEQTWRGTGAQADLEALLRERLRTGDLTRERLQLAAYLGEPAAAAVHDSPTDDALDAAVASTRFAGVEGEVAAAWDALTARLAERGNARRILDAARRTRLSALVPVYSHYVAGAVEFSRCTGPEYAVVATIGRLRSSSGGEPIYAVRCPGDGPHPSVFSTPAAAVGGAAWAVPTWRPVWRGDRHALPLDRLRLGAVDEPRTVGALLVGLGSWGAGVQARAIAALLDAAPEQPPGVERVASALRRWSADDPSAREALREAGHHAQVATTPDVAPTWAAALAIQAGRDALPLTGDLDGWRFPDDSALRRRLRDAVAPWALGLADPAVEAAR